MGVDEISVGLFFPFYTRISLFIFVILFVLSFSFGVHGKLGVIILYYTYLELLSFKVGAAGQSFKAMN